jgi:ATP-dependent Lhr-like helicase
MALPWPADTDMTHRPGRKAGALVALVDGALVWFLERGGKSLLSFGAEPEAQGAAASALAHLVGSGRVPALLVERVNGVTVLDPNAGEEHATVLASLITAGFSRTPRGLRLR